MTRDRSTLLDIDGALDRTLRIAPRPIEVRAADDDGALTLDGYACITNHGYDIYGGPPYGWTEIVARGAFRKTLSERCDVQLLINHDGEPLARTKSGTLELDEDDLGLHVLAQLETSDPDVARIAPKMQRGDMDEMSFAFRVTRQRWEDLNGEEADPAIAPVRRILEVNLNKGDVSVVNYGANDATSVSVRTLDRALAELRAGRTIDPDAAAALRALLAGIEPSPAPTPEPKRTLIPVAALRQRRITPAA